MSAVRRLLVTQDGSGNYLAGGRYLPRILGASAVAVSGPADTNENILATITIQAGAMGLNGILRVTTCFSFTNSANTKAGRIRLGGIGGTAFLSQTGWTTQLGLEHITTIYNRGATNSQVGGGIGVADSGPVAGQTRVTGTIDTSAATTLVITGQKGLAGDTLTLESYLVELILP